MMCPFPSTAMDSLSGENRYEGLFFDLNLGLSKLHHTSFDKNPSLTEACLGLGYDYYLLQYLAVGISSRACYDHQIDDGAKVGGTYTGTYLNPINVRVVFSFFNTLLSYEHLFLSTYETTKATSAGHKIKWSGDQGYRITLTLPLSLWGGHLGLTYADQHFDKQKTGPSSLELTDFRKSSVGVNWSFHNLFESSVTE